MSALPPFRVAHAVSPQWRSCIDQIVEQLEAQARRPGRGDVANLGIVYIGAPLAPHASDIHTLLKTRTGVADWVGTVGGAVLAGANEWCDEPAVVVMLAALPPGSFQVFSGARRPSPLGTKTVTGADASWSALVHADPDLPDLADLIADMAGKVEGSHLFGGLSSGDAAPLPQIAERTLHGGLSGVVFSSEIAIRTRVSQGCAPLGTSHRVSRCNGNLVLELDDGPALDVLLRDLGIAEAVRQSRDGDTLLGAFPSERLRHGLLAGLGGDAAEPGFGLSGYRVRNVVGIDPHNRIVAVGAEPQIGEQLVFCTRDSRSARQDLIRMATELREELEAERLTIKGGIYVSCAARGQAMFAEPGVEAGLLQACLGAFPLIGFFANGEVAGQTLHGNSGVLTLFV